LDLDQTESSAPPVAVPAGLTAILTGLVALGSISVSIYLPALPEIGKDLSAGQSAGAATLTVFLLTFALGQLLYGPVADRIGRRAPLLAGIGIYAAGSLACALAPTLPLLIAARFLQALGASAGPALGRAVMRDLFEGRRLTSAMAMVTAAVALSPMLGPAIGGVVAEEFGWRAIFFALMGVALIIGFLAAVLLPETRPRQTGPTANALSAYRSLLADQEFRSSVLCAGLLTAGNFAWNASAPFLFAELFAVTPEAYGDDALIVGAGYVAGTLLAGVIGRFLSPETLVYAGLSLCTLGAVIAVAIGTPAAAWMLLAPMAIFTLGMGIVVPAAAACALSRFPASAGAAAGLLGAVQILTGAVGSSTAGLGKGAVFVEAEIALSSIAACYFGYLALAPLRQQRSETS
jgi:DHA1 family bicyclomycin/chloramphenicol resistance-like MFS transporter